MHPHHNIPTGEYSRSDLFGGYSNLIYILIGIHVVAVALWFYLVVFGKKTKVKEAQD